MRPGDRRPRHDQLGAVRRPARALEHPDQWARLSADPGLVPTAVEEMIRWVSPVKQFMRTATTDTEVRGVPIAKGESSGPSSTARRSSSAAPQRLPIRYTMT